MLSAADTKTNCNFPFVSLSGFETLEKHKTNPQQTSSSPPSPFDIIITAVSRCAATWKFHGAFKFTRERERIWKRRKKLLHGLSPLESSLTKKTFTLLLGRKTLRLGSYFREHAINSCLTFIFLFLDARKEHKFFSY